MALSEIQKLDMTQEFDSLSASSKNRIVSSSSKQNLIQELLKLKQQGNLNELDKLIQVYSSQLPNILSRSTVPNQSTPTTNKETKQEQKQFENSPINKENIEKMLSHQPRVQQSIKIINQIINVTNTKGQQLDKVSFGQCLPGYILEEGITLENISMTHCLICEVKVLCLDEVLNDLDEYVFSIRKKENYSYGETQVFKLRPGTKMQVFLALKTPNLKKEQKIPGKVLIKATGVRNVIEMDIDADVKIPEITCLKTLHSKEYKMPVIKLAMKLVNKAECKIPFKNMSKFNVKTEFELMISEENKFAKGIEFCISPDQGILPGNQVAMVVLNARKVGFNHEMLKNSSITVNMLLIVKIQNSTLILCFPLMIEIY